MMMVHIAAALAAVGASLPFTFEVQAGELDLRGDGFSFVGTAAVCGEVTNTGQACRIHGVVKAEKTFVCDRCLGDFRKEESYAFDEEVRLEDGAESDGMVLLALENDAVDIEALVRDTILSAQPLNNICRPDCRGLCSKCGADLNRGECGCDRFVPDPRLSALQQLLKEK